MVKNNIYFSTESIVLLYLKGFSFGSHTMKRKRQNSLCDKGVMAKDQKTCYKRCEIVDVGDQKI